MAWMYQLFIDGWGDPSYFTSANWLLASDPMICGMISCMVQLFFAWRLNIISKQPLLTAFIAMASLATFLGGVGTGIAVLWVKEYARLGQVKGIGLTWDFSTVIADMTITAGMTYYLRRHRGSFEITDRLLDRIIQLTLQNGLLTSVATLVNVSFYLATPKVYHIGWPNSPYTNTAYLLTSIQALTFLMPKLYSNSVLSSLNSRKQLRALNISSDEHGVRSGIYHSTQPPLGQTGTRHAEVIVEIHEMTDTESLHGTDKRQLQPEDM
ncbi:hypothetical protein HWV62_9425 [Athelia sp. TMB]|nr:hypothetical protein HWV62_9425 [Athelia sp. TMB]